MPAALTANVRTYAELRRSVEHALLAGQREVERTKVRTYWETGRLICEHLLLNADRAEYGAGVITRLAGDLKVDRSVLHRCVRFARCFPIVAGRRQLAWAHYRLLIEIEDKATRRALELRADREGWIAKRLEQEVRRINASLDPGSTGAHDMDGQTAPVPADELLTPKRGIVGRYRVITLDDGLGIDLGFKLCLPLPSAQARYRTAGEIVAVDAEGRVSAVKDGTSADLFTYDVTVRRVIDGDTVEVALALPCVVLRQKLRLRGLDCPEIDTAGGKAAKRRVESLFGAAKSVTIYTTKPDKYDRYLADVFLALAVSDKLKAGSSESGAEIFLNNHLLENGLAERKDAWEFGDWEKVALR